MARQHSNRRPDSEAPALFAFEGVRRPVSFSRAGRVYDHLSAILNGWPRRGLPDALGEPEIAIEGRGSVYRITAPWLPDAIYEPTAVSATCSIIVDLVRAYLFDNPQFLCLHCGAVRIGGKLVVFPSTNRVGKSTLVTRLASAGHPVFADDLLPIANDGSAMSLGIAPRLRLPVPDGASEEFRRFAERHAGPDDGYYRYILPDRSVWSRFGAVAPLGAVVLLDRQPEGKARIAAAPTGLALRQLIVQNVARSGPALDIIDRLRAILDDIPCLMLTYSDPEQPVALLERTFSDWSEDPADAAKGVERAPNTTPPECKADTAGPDSVGSGPDTQRRFIRHPDVQLRSVDGELLLVDPVGTAIFHLNAMGSGVWNLLEAPLSPSQVLDAFILAFPDLDPAAAGHDVATLFAALEAGGLIMQVEN